MNSPTNLFSLSALLLLAPVFMSIAVIQFVLTVMLSIIPETKSQRLGLNQIRSKLRRGRLILVILDDKSLDVINWTIHNILEANDFVHIVYVLKTHPAKMDGHILSFTSKSYDQISSAGELIECCELLEEAEIPFDGQMTTAELEDDPDKTILQIIDHVEPELVVLGLKKETVEGQDIGGTVSSVALNSPISVMLVK